MPSSTRTPQWKIYARPLLAAASIVGCASRTSLRKEINQHGRSRVKIWDVGNPSQAQTASYKHRENDGAYEQAAAASVHSNPCVPKWR